MYENLAVLVVFAFIFSVVAGRIERSTITGPMVFIAFGVIAGPVGLGILNMETTN
ncbi:MAG: sodium:proton antiporter, partial [Deltaproteobacteria bacterium]|nr:sodium:proton antiporter [Deltaproteobacteria bacterium]